MPVHPLKVAIAVDGRKTYQVAAAAEINPSEVSRIISGKQPSDPVKERLAAALGRTVDELFPVATTTSTDAA